jgi:hypothetical protein
MKKIPNDAFFEEVADLLSKGENVNLRVKGNSMRPYLCGDGSETVLLLPVSSAELNLGSIILFFHDNRYIFHRLVQKKRGKLYVQGDGNCRQTEIIEPQSVIGVAHSITRSGGKTFSANSFTTQIYWRCWYFLRPLRRYLLAIYKRINIQKI